MNNEFIEYLFAHQKPADTRFFVFALMQQLVEQAHPDELQALMHASGVSAARTMPLASCQTVAELQEIINVKWSELNWGCVRLIEHPEHLLIEHMWSPFRDLFSPFSLEPGAAFLEGVYQEWFIELGAGSQLRVRFMQIDPETGALLFRFGA